MPLPTATDISDAWDALKRRLSLRQPEDEIPDNRSMKQLVTDPGQSRPDAGVSTSLGNAAKQAQQSDQFSN